MTLKIFPLIIANTWKYLESSNLSLKNPAVQNYWLENAENSFICAFLWETFINVTAT